MTNTKPRARKPRKVGEKSADQPKAFVVPMTAVALSRRRPAAKQATPFAIPKPPPGVLPASEAKLAMDSQPALVAASGWAAGYNWAFAEGMEFLGYPYLAELSQRPEYRRAVEVIATEMTRKWVRLHTTGDDDKSEKIAAIEAEMIRLDVRGAFKKVAEQDGFFGRGHLYLDTGKSEDRDELVKPIGDGRSKLSKNKVGKGDLKALRPVEAVWTYPTNYNSNDPLQGSWYKPDVWYVMGKQIHASRLLSFIGREVPDLLKPAYSFGGLALTQMMKPYVDNWLETRQSVNDAVSAYSTMVLATDMAQRLQQGGESLDRRIELYTNYRNNRGTMVVDKEAEQLTNVAAPLGSLDLLQAQAQEHMAAACGIPLVKLLGITPSGLNASSDGEIRCFYDWIAAYQIALFGANLTTVLNFVQLSLFGEVDEEIAYEFEPLWALDEKEQAEVQKIEAETAQIRIDSGVIAPEEERSRIASDPKSAYDGLDPDKAPDMLEEEEEGLATAHGHPDDKLIEGSEEEGGAGGAARQKEAA